MNVKIQVFSRRVPTARKKLCLSLTSCFSGIINLSSEMQHKHPNTRGWQSADHFSVMASGVLYKS